jgi:hypothetical protein
MSETEKGGALQPAAEHAPGRSHRHRRRPFLVRYWWLVPLVVLLIVVPLVWRFLFGPQTRNQPLAGYITGTNQIEAEYLTFTGRSLDPMAAAQFDRATELMKQGNYGSAAIILETAAKQIPVPAVFNDLGVLYEKLKDGPHALRAFRDALARDHDYAPVRANLRKMNRNESADPGATELEPNNDISQANAVWLERPVQAAISPSVGDVDSFWFITPRPPRDRVSISVVNQSSTLIPRLRIYDQNENLVTGLKEAPSPGASVRFDFSPPPNTLYYVQVDGVSGTSGAYALSVSALHAYDIYEPNDTILTAARIVPGQTTDANIMDGDDTDFYSFVSTTAGTVSIDVVPGSNTLQLGLGMFAPDLHSIGFAPDPKSPGDSIHQPMQVEANQRYYLQIFSKHDTAGPYSLVVK